MRGYIGDNEWSKVVEHGISNSLRVPVFSKTKMFFWINLVLPTSLNF